MNFTLSDVAAAVGLRKPAIDARLSGVAVDSRKARTGDLFVAIPGARVDGSEFAVAAVSAGAGAVLAARVPPTL